MFKMMANAAAAAMMIVALGTSAAAEEVIRLSGAAGEPTLLLRRERGSGPVVLFVHGATFPSELSVAWRIDGRSWMDDLRSRGFDVWAFDFAGYGGSDRPAAMTRADAAPVGRGPEAADQIDRVVRHVLETSGRPRLSVLAHSWGTVPASIFSGRRPDLVERLVLFGPVARRDGPLDAGPPGGGYRVTAADQWNSFHSGLPEGQPALIAPDVFAVWAAAYLASSPEGREGATSVLTPTGPQIDLAEAWAGSFPYDPSAIRSPTLIVRGEWDASTTDADARWLVDAFTAVPGGAVDVKLPRGAHRMHLEQNRQALFDAVGAFLAAPSAP